MLTKSRVIQLFIMLFVLLLGAVWWGGSYFYNVKSNNSEQSEVNLAPCDYSSPCEFVGKQGKFWLSVNNPPIQAERWIDFNLHLNYQTGR